MDLFFFLVLLISAESLAYRGNCGGDDYYQDRHHGIRRHYQRAQIFPDEFYPHPNPPEDADDIINQGPDEVDDSPFEILSRQSRWNKLKFPKLFNHHHPKKFGYRTINKNFDAYENNSPELGASNDIKELIPRKKSYGSSLYRQANANILGQTHRGGINSGIIISRVKNSRGTLSKHRDFRTDSDLDEDIAKVDHFNAHPTIIISTRSDSDIDAANENDNTNINTNANINGGAGGSTILISTRRNALNSDTEYGEVSDIVPNDNELSPMSSNNPTIIVSTRQQQTEGNENQNINVNSNVNAENGGGGGSAITIGARNSMLNSERQQHGFRRNAGGIAKNAAANTNKNVNVNTNVNSEGEGNSAVIIAARRDQLEAEANYGSRSNIIDNQYSGVRRNNNNNNNINVNANVNSEDAESSPAIIVAGRRKSFKDDASYGSRRNMADNQSIGARQNDNKNINVNNNVNANGERNTDILIAARRHALKAEANYGARNNLRRNEDESTGMLLQGRDDLDPADIISRRNANENSNVNINVNAEDAGGSPSILAVARRRLSGLNDNDKNIIAFPRQNIHRRSQAPKNENRNVNINVNRLESDEV